MTDSQKKSNWNELAEKIGVSTPPEATPAPPPTSQQPVESATPPPPPKRQPAPVKKSGWGTIASLLGIETSRPAEAPSVETPAVEAPSAVAPAASEIQSAAEQRTSDTTEDTTEDLRPAPVDARATDAVRESPSPTETFRAEAPDAVEETGVSSRGSSRGRRRGGGRTRVDDSPEDAGEPVQEPVARSASPEAKEPADGFDGDDEDPLLLPADTFVDEVDVAYDELSDSIDNAEVVPSPETTEERPKRRRRRGRRRGRRDGASSDEAGLKSEEAAPDNRMDKGPAAERFADDDLGAELQSWVDDVGTEDDAEDAEDVVKDGAGDKPEAAERASRKRRRGRRRRGGKRDEPAARAGTDAEKTSQTAPQVDSQPASASTDELDDDDDDDMDDNSVRDDGDDGDEHGGFETRHRKIPTWSDAIGGIVDSNLATRSKNPSPPRRGRGGRGRQGDRSHS